MLRHYKSSRTSAPVWCACCAFSSFASWRLSLNRLCHCRSCSSPSLDPPSSASFSILRERTSLWTSSSSSSLSKVSAPASPSSGTSENAFVPFPPLSALVTNPSLSATSRNKIRQRPRRVRPSLRRFPRQFSFPLPRRRQRRRHRLRRANATSPPASSVDATRASRASRYSRSFDAGLDAPGGLRGERGRVVPSASEVRGHGFWNVVVEREESGVVDSGFQYAGNARSGEHG